MAQESSSLAHNIVTIWFAVSSVVVLWDAGFCLLRPRSMPGGDLYWIWAVSVSQLVSDVCICSYIRQGPADRAR